MTLSPRQKLVGAALLALALPLAAASQGASAANAARALLALGALGGLVAWYFKARGAPASFKAAPRLKVIQRAGLSPRAGVALIEVDGKPYVIVHGDGFAKLQPTRQPRRPTAPKPSQRAERLVVEALS